VDFSSAYQPSGAMDGRVQQATGAEQPSRKLLPPGTFLRPCHGNGLSKSIVTKTLVTIIQQRRKMSPTDPTTSESPNPIHQHSFGLEVPAARYRETNISDSPANSPRRQRGNI